MIFKSFEKNFLEILILLFVLISIFPLISGEKYTPLFRHDIIGKFLIIHIHIYLTIRDIEYVQK